MTYFTFSSEACAMTNAATASPWERPEIIRSTAWPVLCSPALARNPPMLPRWKTESTAEQTRAALGIRPRLRHRAETLVLYEPLGAAAVPDAAPPPFTTACGFTVGLGFGLGLATALTPATPTASGASGAAPAGADTAGSVASGAASRTADRAAARSAVRVAAGLLAGSAKARAVGLPSTGS